MYKSFSRYNRVIRMHVSREESAHERMIHDGPKFGFHPAVVSHPENYILVIREFRVRT